MLFSEWLLPPELYRCNSTKDYNFKYLKLKATLKRNLFFKCLATFSNNLKIISQPADTSQGH